MRHHATYYLALEKYLLNNTDQEYFFTWDIFPTIVCGKHQLLQNEVNLDYLKSIGVELTRRHSGGGTVFADEGDFMFTFISRSTAKDDVFKSALTEIADMLAKVGVKAEISGRNDLMFQGKKFSGNAYYRNDKGSILHGTMMYDVDIEKLVRSLTPDNEKLISKGIESVRQRVVNLKPYLGGMTREELMAHFENSVKYQIPVLSKEEEAEVLKIEEGYRSDEWIWGNNPAYTYNNKIRFNWGGADLHLNVKGNKITDMRLTGDFFTHKALEPLYEKFINQDNSRERVTEIVSKMDFGEFVLGASNEDLLQLFGY